MALFNPKYPRGGAPAKKPTRQQRHEQKLREAEERHKTITEADLRKWEQAGYKVDRRSKYVVVEWRNKQGGWEMRSFTVLGNGRYGKR